MAEQTPWVQRLGLGTFADMAAEQATPPPGEGVTPAATVLTGYALPDTEGMSVSDLDAELEDVADRLDRAERELAALRVSNRLRGQRANRERARRAFVEGERDACEDIISRAASAADDVVGSLVSALTADDVGALVNAVHRAVERLRPVRNLGGTPQPIAVATGPALEPPD